MDAERFPHLFPPTPPESRLFTSPLSGGSEKDLPSRNTQAHGTLLQARFAQAWQDSQGRRAAAHSTRRGCYLEFKGEPGHELALKTMDSGKAGIRLLNVRTENNAMLATVYIPDGQTAYFIGRFQDYLSKVTPKGSPRHNSFVARISDIYEALARAFWTDRPDAFPGEERAWIEVWLATEDDEAIGKFRGILLEREIPEHPQKPLLKFPERSVLLISANEEDLTCLVEWSDDIAEFRIAAETAYFFLEHSNKDQADWCQSLLDRLRLEHDSDVSVCILDHGVNQGHPLLEGLLSVADLHTNDPNWGTADHDGHGTLMAGLAAYGDLQAALESSAEVVSTHRLESAKIHPPRGENPQHLWGDVTAQGISRAETEAIERKRIICLAMTATRTRRAGRPTSWSAELDALAAGMDIGRRRMIVVSAGNVLENWEDYPAENKTNEVHDPAQAWNALTVGACTFKTAIPAERYSGHHPIAGSGGLSPFSTTSQLWDRRHWPIKPEVVFEGGNVAVDAQGTAVELEDLALLSTSKHIHTRHLESFQATSAATAQAAWFAARIQAAYPGIWPETVRALMVHSARWSAEMARQFLQGEKKGDYSDLLRTCGYGIPDLPTALSCMKSSLTLIAQREIQPFFLYKGKGGKRPATHEMHLHNLPWPQAELLALGEANVTMRVTLSYFVEPSPGEIGWKDRYRYASHAIRFALNGPGEDAKDFAKRINKRDREEDGSGSDTEGPGRHWKLGRLRDVGSIHSDIWTGRAADLASSHYIAVYPVVGWWRERKHLGKLENAACYSLVVSIETPPEKNIDIYTPVSASIGIPTPVAVEIY